MCERLNETKVTVGEKTSVNDVLSVLKNVVIAVAAKVIVYRVHMGWRKGSA